MKITENKKPRTRRDPLPQDFNTIEEFWSFWDTHSSADYEDFMEDVSVEINKKACSRPFNLFILDTRWKTGPVNKRSKST
jgi:hypothetical protein